MHRREHITAVMLVGHCDFGRHHVATRLPPALWPVGQKTVLERLLVHLAEQGVRQVAVCSGGLGTLLAELLRIPSGLQVSFLDKPLPVGAAGCVRDSVCHQGDSLVLIMSASITSPPPVDVLVRAHRDGQSDLTIMFNPGFSDARDIGVPADIYICDSQTLELVPKAGYFDIKEGVIPEMIRAGKAVRAVKLPKPVGNFRDWREYLFAVGNYLEGDPQMGGDLKLCRWANSATVWAADTVYLDPSVQIHGPVVIMEGAHISKNATLIGPLVIGRNVNIGEGSLLANSVLWDYAKIGPNCEIQQCLIDNHAVVPPNTVVEDKPITCEAQGRLKSLLNTARIVKSHARKLRAALQPQLARMSARLPSGLRHRDAKLLLWLAAALFVMAFLWSYWSGIVELWSIWQRSDEYSSGLLVPFLVVYILWSRRNDLVGCKIRPCVWGIVAFAGAQATRLFGLVYTYSSAEWLSVVLSIAAILLLLFGWRFFRKVSAVMLFLCLMLPWPSRIQTAVTLPLQRWATSSAVFCLETMGYNVVQEGNVIHIGNASVAVAEACNGLRMVTAFFVISGLVVLLVKRTWWEKLIVFASSLPIALLCNTTRLAITAIAFTVVSGEYWEKVFHDFGGYAMMPLALAVVVAELWILAKLTTPPTEQETIVITRQTQ